MTKSYDVTIEATVRKTLRVRAKDDQSATELAHQRFTVSSEGGEDEKYDEQTISVNEVKKKAKKR